MPVTVALESEPVVAVVVTASPGERNRIQLSEDINGLHVEDSNPMVAGPGCRANEDNSVSCPDPTGSVRVLRVALGDGDDSVGSGFDERVFTFLSGGAGLDSVFADHLEALTLGCERRLRA